MLCDVPVVGIFVGGVVGFGVACLMFIRRRPPGRRDG